MKKKYWVFTSVLLIFSLILGGCNSKKETISVEKMAEVYFDLFITGNSASAKEVGISDDDIKKVIEIDEEESKRLIKLNFTSAGLPITDEQLNEIYEAQKNAYKKIKPEITVESSDEETAVVKIVTPYVNITEADNNAVDAAIKIAEDEQITDENKLSDIYIEKLIENTNAVEPSSDTKENTFKFKKVNMELNGEVTEAWVPENNSEFGTNLGKMVSGQ